MLLGMQLICHESYVRNVFFFFHTVRTCDGVPRNQHRESPGLREMLQTSSGRVKRWSYNSIMYAPRKTYWGIKMSTMVEGSDSCTARLVLPSRSGYGNGGKKISMMWLLGSTKRGSNRHLRQILELRRQRGRWSEGHGGTTDRRS